MIYGLVALDMRGGRVHSFKCNSRRQFWGLNNGRSVRCLTTYIFLIFLLFHASTRCFGGRRESLATSFCLLFALVMKRIKTFHKNKTSKDLLLLLLTYEQYIGMSQPFTTTFSLLSLNFFSSNFFSLTKSLFFNFHTACLLLFL